MALRERPHHHADGLAQQTGLPAGHWIGQRAASDIFVLATNDARSVPYTDRPSNKAGDTFSTPAPPLP
jgi:hypothetical protein